MNFDELKNEPTIIICANWAVKVYFNKKSTIQSKKLNSSPRNPAVTTKVRGKLQKVKNRQHKYYDDDYL